MLAIMMRTAIGIVVALLAPLASEALAQSRETFKDANGRVVGWATTNNAGTVYYDASARRTGRSTSDSKGNTTYYDAMGRNTGRSVTQGNVVTFRDHTGRTIGTSTRR